MTLSKLYRWHKIREIHDQPVCHGFNHNWSVFSECNLSCLCSCIENCHKIITINSDSHHTVSWCSRSNTITRILVFSRSLGKKESFDYEPRYRLTEMAKPLFLQKKITGHLSVAAKLKAAWASPSDAAPSPK